MWGRRPQSHLSHYRQNCFAPHVSAKRISDRFGEVKDFPQGSRWLCTSLAEIPVDVETGGNLQGKVQHGNDLSAALHANTNRAEVARDVTNGRAPVFNRLRASENHKLRMWPLDLLERRELRIVHDLNLRGHTIPSVNHGTDVSAAPP